MIPNALIDEAREYAYDQVKRHGAPALFHIDFTANRAKELARSLGADENIVEVGTLLMDCQLGIAMKEKRLAQHIEMGTRKAAEIIARYSEVTKEETDNIVACIQEHHGSAKFTSRESEICCNADCYRFASVVGIVGGLNTFRGGMGIDELIKLWSEKADEKWNTLSLDICKKELEPQYESIRAMFKEYKSYEH